jgi:hypothetical protein
MQRGDKVELIRGAAPPKKKRIEMKKKTEKDIQIYVARGEHL